MSNHIQGSIVINAPAEAVWRTITDPDKIILYLDTKTYTDWKVGSPIIWEAELPGAKIQSKGMVLETVPGELLRFTFWTGFGGEPDRPENYSEVTYKMRTLNESAVRLVYERSKIPTTMEKDVFETHLPGMLEALKAVAEKIEPHDG